MYWCALCVICVLRLCCTHFHRVFPVNNDMHYRLFIFGFRRAFCICIAVGAGGTHNRSCRRRCKRCLHAWRDARGQKRVTGKTARSMFIMFMLRSCLGLAVIAWLTLALMNRADHFVCRDRDRHSACLASLSHCERARCQRAARSSCRVRSCGSAFAPSSPMRTAEEEVERLLDLLGPPGAVRPPPSTALTVDTDGAHRMAAAAGRSRALQAARQAGHDAARAAPWHRRRAKHLVVASHLVGIPWLACLWHAVCAPPIRSDPQPICRCTHHHRVCVFACKKERETK